MLISLRLRCLCRQKLFKYSSGFWDRDFPVHTVLEKNPEPKIQTKKALDFGVWILGPGCGTYSLFLIVSTTFDGLNTEFNYYLFH